MAAVLRGCIPPDSRIRRVAVPFGTDRVHGFEARAAQWARTPTSRLEQRSVDMLNLVYHNTQDEKVYQAQRDFVDRLSAPW